MASLMIISCFWDVKPQMLLLLLLLFGVVVLLLYFSEFDKRPLSEGIYFLGDKHL